MSGWKRIFEDPKNYQCCFPGSRPGSVTNFGRHVAEKVKPVEKIRTKALVKDGESALNEHFRPTLTSPCGKLRADNGQTGESKTSTWPWTGSYVSARTFEQNKINGFDLAKNQNLEFPLLSFRIDLKKQTCHLRSNCFVSQCRTFKTWSLEGTRKSIVELINRFKSMGPQKKQSTNELISDDIETYMKSQMTSDGDGPKNENDKLKIAFAEGYLTGSRQQVTPQTPKWMKILQPVLTVFIVIGLCLAFLASTNGSMFRMQIGKQIEIDPIEINITFEDVKGVDEAKQELKEVVEFLKNPEKFSALGGKLPKGVLLVGPPGTGKTLLARAVAGEARVPFFHAAGPEFDEILVGQGARRVRDLFKAAKESAPCVIFIDEIDSVGSKRTNSVLHPYANQTINQLLSEMDGFHQNEGVIVLGATNRREDLDKALLRPGRFDVEVMVPTPDYNGRKQIFQLYLGKVLCKEVDVDILARGTVGFTGADIENMVNQAALKAAVEGADCVTMTYLENARDKVLMGPERKSRIPDEEANLITAYHEGGHTIVGFYTKDAHPLHKVTIMPRGPSLGHTAYIPEKERYHVTKSQLLAIMDTMMGGRAAEELIFGPDRITSGSSNDLKQATMIATKMVKDWGMSEKIGLRTLDDGERSTIVVNELGQTLSEAIDAEIKRLLQESYERAKSILKAHAKEHKLLAEALIRYETLDADDIKSILRGGGGMGKDDDRGELPVNLDEW
ncbi:ATP-dependent zinc metalloprotease yme1l [Polyplax serrata]|uniref:ATP-dependent zinc metalloprotease yme1l n=1 Tax=Polyplax serrata TaxID=468196 RepID=A0ABR1ANK4_POLSC